MAIQPPGAEGRDAEGRDALLESDVASPVGEWVVPSDIRHEGRDLVWSKSEGFIAAPVPDRRMVGDFAALIDADADKITAFARRWGVLDICQHGLPASHNLPPSGAYWGEPEWCHPIEANRGGRRVLVEPLSAWHTLATVFNGALDVATTLLDGKPGSEEAWARFHQPPAVPNPSPMSLTTFDEPDTPRVTARVRQERAYFASCVQRLLDCAHIRPRFVWGQRQQRPTSELVPGSLFAAITIEITGAIEGTDGLARCSACGSFFAPLWRSPRAGQRRYCAQCRRAKRPQRDAERDSRQRKSTRTKGKL